MKKKMISIFDVLSKKMDEKKLLGVVSALVDRSKVKEKDIELLEAMLEEKRAQLHKKKKK